MNKTCSKCLVEKDISEFYYRKDSEKLRDQCKECWKYRSSATRLGISFEMAKEYYRQPTCMCCGENFKTKREHHLHHVNHKVKGVICHYCNIALEQETPETLKRLQACLDFMSSSRKNPFDKGNQQGRSGKGILPFPSTSRRRKTSDERECKFCNRILPLKHFYQRKYKNGKIGYHTACKECHKIYVKTYQYGLSFEQISILRSTPRCDCCNLHFTEKSGPYTHHVGERILGVVCRGCNALLEQETDLTKHKIKSCIEFV